MQLDALTCNKCGAPLDVPKSANFVTCSYCNSRLAIKREGGAQYTEVLNRIDERTERMEGDLTSVRLHSELERIDREWQQTNLAFATRVGQSKSAALNHKGASVTYLGPAIGLVGGVFLFILLWRALPADSINTTCTLYSTPFVIMLVAGVALVITRTQLLEYNTLVKAHNELLQEYTNAEKAYIDKRTRIVHQLEQDTSRDVQHS